MRLSVIIPTYNEEVCLARLLHYLSGLPYSAPYEIIVADGGSDDRTETIALEAGVILVKSEKGRARQMNKGAYHAKGDVLYFLHADTIPPPGFDVLISGAVERGYQAGCFRMKFDHPSYFLKFFSWFTRINWRICRGGDQTLFIAKNLFDRLTGFDESYSIYEDGEFFGRLYKTTRIAILPQEVITSARKYELRGKWSLQYHFAMIHLHNFLGAGPEQLYDYYRRKIAV